MEEKISALIAAAEEKLAPAFKRLEAIEEIGTRRVLAAFQEHQVAYRHFAPTTGYGYDDVGRDPGKDFCRPFWDGGGHCSAAHCLGYTRHFPLPVWLDAAGRPYSFRYGQAL